MTESVAPTAPKRAASLFTPPPSRGPVRASNFDAVAKALWSKANQRLGLALAEDEID